MVRGAKKTARCSPCEGLPSGPSENVFAPNPKWFGGRTNCWTESRTGAHTVAYVLQASLSLYWQGGSQRCCCGCPACCCCGSLHGSWSGRCSTTRRESPGWSLCRLPVGLHASKYWAETQTVYPSNSSPWPRSGPTFVKCACVHA